MKRGPKSVEGKRAVSGNAITHGLRSSSPVIVGESEAEWNAFLAGIAESCKPVGKLEEDIVQHLANRLWMQARCERCERTLFDEVQDRNDSEVEPPSESTRMPPGPDSEAREHRTNAQLLKDFLIFPPDELLPDDVSQAVLQLVCSEEGRTLDRIKRRAGDVVLPYGRFTDNTAADVRALIELPQPGRNVPDAEVAVRQAIKREMTMAKNCDRAGVEQPTPSTVSLVRRPTRMPDPYNYPIELLMRYTIANERSIHRWVLQLQMVQDRRRELDAADAPLLGWPASTD